MFKPSATLTTVLLALLAGTVQAAPAAALPEVGISPWGRKTRSAA